MKKIKITKSTVRRLALYQQGLLQLPHFGTGKDGIVNAIKSLGYLQIDTLSVVERAHNHILWSRSNCHTSNNLNDAHTIDKSIFEYWYHAAAYLPMDDYRYYLPRMNAFAKKKGAWFPRDQEVQNRVLAQIKNEGPMSSKDFKTTQLSKQSESSWWDWKPEKQALDRLWLEGHLMVTKRNGFQKVYDLTEHVLPSTLDLSMPSDNDCARFFILQVINAYGVADLNLIKHFNPSSKKQLSIVLAELVNAKILVEIEIEGLLSRTFYTTNDLLNKLSTLPENDPQIHILSPFDNLIIQRQWLKDIFAFDYSLECYVPESKRKYGYFVLPILQGEQFVARMDAKADRKSAEFIIKNFVVEPSISGSIDWDMVSATIRNFTSFNQCNTIKVENNKQLAKKLCIQT